MVSTGTLANDSRTGSAMRKIGISSFLSRMSLMSCFASACMGSFPMSQSIRMQSTSGRLAYAVRAPSMDRIVVTWIPNPESPFTIRFIALPWGVSVVRVSSMTTTTSSSSGFKYPHLSWICPFIIWHEFSQPPLDQAFSQFPAGIRSLNREILVRNIRFRQGNL